jgi:hypothetical protein
MKDETFFVPRGQGESARLLKNDMTGSDERGTLTIDRGWEDRIKFITHPDADGVMGSCGGPCYQCKKDEKLKQFITNLLAEQKAEIIERVEKAKRRHFEETSFIKHRNDFNDAYNEVVDDIINIIKE